MILPQALSSSVGHRVLRPQLLWIYLRKKNTLRVKRKEGRTQNQSEREREREKSGSAAVKTSESRSRPCGRSATSSAFKQENRTKPSSVFGSQSGSLMF